MRPRHPERKDGGQHLADYRSTYKLGVALQLLLVVYVVVAAWSFVAGSPYLRSLIELRDSGAIDDVERFLDLEAAFGAAAGLEAFVYLTIGVVWTVWFYLSYRNVDALGRTRTHAASWAIFGWFVPVLSLYRPRQIAGEMWVESRPLSAMEPAPDRQVEREAPWFLNAWWGLFVAMNIALVVNRVMALDDSLASYVMVVRWEMATVVAAALCAIAATLVVGSINNRQTALAQVLNDGTSQRL